MREITIQVLCLCLVFIFNLYIIFMGDILEIFVGIISIITIIIIILFIMLNWEEKLLIKENGK